MHESHVVKRSINDMSTAATLTKSAGVAVFALASSYGAAGATVFSYHGDDYSYDYNNLRALANCDQESDSNHTKGLYDYDTSTSGSDGEIEDSNGANGDCAQSGALSRDILRHRTCEKNNISWDCDNWADTGK
jgi:hypothetical protein